MFKKIIITAFYYFLDIDECSDHNGGCSEYCSNVDGSYQCYCKTGLHVAVDGKTCIGK